MRNAAGRWPVGLFIGLVLMEAALRTAGRPLVWAFEGPSIEKTDARTSFVLGNGLTVHVVQTPSPLVASLAIVKAGSRDEDETVRGVSHLLEHLLFDGTERRTKEVLFQEIYGMGGYINGFTREDLTGYILMVHPDFFEKLLDIQADILFHATLDLEKLKVTKGVVEEEIRQALTNPAYHEEVLHKASLYAGTPYASPILGTEEGIARMTRDQILGYYKRHYVPNNMLLVVIGPLQPKEVFKAVEKRFSPYPPAPLPQPDRLNWPPLQRSRALVFETEASRKSITLSLRLDPAEGADMPLLDLLAQVLNSRIEQAFEKPSEPQVFKKEASLSVLRDFLTLDLFVTFPQGTDEDRVLELLVKEMTRLAQDGVEEGELELAKRQLQADEVFLKERIHYYAMEKASRIVALGPEALTRHLPRLKAITREVVSRAARRILADPPFTASIFLPRVEGKQTGAVVPLPPEKVVLENGLTLIAQEIPGSEVLAVHVLVRHRSAQEPEKRAGIAEFLHRMLPRGTKNRTAEAITKALQAMGGKLEVAGDPTTPFGDFYTSREFSYIRLEALAVFLREALDLLQDLIMNPAFPPEEIERVRAELFGLIAARAKSPKSQGENLLYAALYPDRPFGRPVYGTEESIRAVTSEDLKAFHRAYFTPGNLIVSVVGNPPAHQVLEELKARFGRLEAQGRPFGSAQGRPPSLAVAPPAGPRIVRAKLGGPQASIVMGRLIRGASEREALALEVAASILSAHLFANLREKEGLAYSIGASVGFYEGSGLLMIQMGTAPQHIERAKEGILKELKATAEEVVPQEELDRRVNALSGRYTMRRLSSINRAFYLGLAEFKGLPHSFGDDYRLLLKGLSPQEVSEAAKKFFLGNEMVIVIVE